MYLKKNFLNQMEMKEMLKIVVDAYPEDPTKEEIKNMNRFFDLLPSVIGSYIVSEKVRKYIAYSPPNLLNHDSLNEWYNDFYKQIYVSFK